jgi:chaperonin GroES
MLDKDDDTRNMIAIPKDEYLTLDEIKKSDNVAELLDGVALTVIANEVVHGYEIDEDSRMEWKDRLNKAMEIYNQNCEPKTEPWEGASNVKYPLIAEAAIGYSSRTLPELIRNDRIVKTVITGNDPQELKLHRGENTAKYVSYQLLVESDDWQDGLDHSLQMLAVQGILFKKTYYCPIEEEIRSEICVPDYIVVNYATKSLTKAARITHIMQMRQNDIIERQRSGIFCSDIELNKLLPESLENPQDNDYEIEILEQHCWLDLDGDGYREPYIITVHKNSRTVLRIVNRFDEIKLTDSGKVKKITATNYFTDYHFIRSGDGGYYSIGFGLLLYPLNSTINTLFNQLIDAGTLSVTQGGFIGRGLRIRNGNLSIKMGEWKVVDAASGVDLQKSIVPLPTREPSDTLFKLLSLLMQIGENLASTTDISRGQQPAQNVAQGTINTLVDQSTKIFAAINKRYYRSLQKELKKIFILNGKYLKNSKYREVLQDPQANVKDDFNMTTLTVYPVADPDMSSENKRLNRAIILQQLPSVDKRAADFFMMKDVMGLEDSQIKMLQPPADPNAPPPPDVIKANSQAQEIQANIATMMAQMQLENQKLQVQMAQAQQAMKESESRIQESFARQVKMAKDAAHGEAKVLIAANKMQSQKQLSEDKLTVQASKVAADTVLDSRAQALNERQLEAEVERTRLEAKKDENI